MIRGYLLVLFFLLSASFCHSIEIDMEDPVSVAKMSYELALWFQYNELRKISCRSASYALDIGEKRAAEAIEKFRANGVDVDDDVSYDLNNITYEIYKRLADDVVVVKVSGFYEMTIQGKSFKGRKFIKYIMLKKINGDFLFYSIR